MRKIILSLAIIGAIGAIVAGATISYYTDTETSTGNTFTAGSIDLKIDNHAWFNGGYMEQFSWELDDLTDKLFFYYEDLKPGDWEEDTISIHVNNNPSWVCGNLTITRDDDMTCTEPEMSDDPTCDEPDSDLWDGELGNELHFIFWVDDGDNVLEENEEIILSGTPSDLPQGGDGQTFPIVDSTFNLFGPVGEPLPGATTVYIGKAFCFGGLTLTPVPGNGGVDPSVDPGFRCNGAIVNNAAQSDSLMGNIGFTAIQSRNNADYVCVVGPGCQSDEECDDGNQCTEDICDENRVCQNTCIVGQSCDDGNERTINDKCTQVGDDCFCEGTPVQCINDEECDDQNECTEDVCDENGVCQNTCLIGDECDDEDRLTINDTCVVLDTGVCECVGEDVDCIDAGDCDDEDPCTIDTCENNVCIFTPIDCNDDNLCTNDSCVGGECVNEPIVCNDNDPCTTDTCDPYTGCVYTPICDGSDTECGCESCVNCDAQDGWVNDGSPYICCQGHLSICDTCQDQRYRDYSCNEYECTYLETAIRTVTSGCVPCPAGYHCEVNECIPDNG